jgi:hypothetical protein
MARARNIKPGLFSNELLGEADPMISLAFIGMWTIADKEGRIEDRPKKIRAQLFPYRSDVDMDMILDWLKDNAFITRYQSKHGPIIAIVNWSKHQRPHHKEVESTLPAQAIDSIETDHDQSKHEPSMVQACAKHESSITPLAQPNPPDTGYLIPDTGFSDTGYLIPGVKAAAPPQPPPAKSSDPKSASVWTAYSEAYQARYQATPVRNAKVNKQLCMLVDRIGADEAPEVARFFLTHNGGFYVARMHSVDLMLADCEKLRTEWATNTRMTRTQAHQIDRTQSNLSVVQSVIAKRKAEGRM